MKKALVILLALCVVGVSFAEDHAFTVKANAEMVTGINLNDNSLAFTNDADVVVTVPIIAKQTLTKGAEVEVYGEITIKDLAFEFDTDQTDGNEDTGFRFDGKNADSVTAKIIAGPLWVQIFGAPGFELNNAQFFKPFYNDSFSDGSLKPNVAATTGGFILGYKMDLFSIEARIGSHGDYDGVEETATDNKFALGAFVSITPMDLIAFNAGFVMSTIADSAKGFTLKATLKPITGFELVGAMDASIPATGDMLMDIAASLAYTLENKSVASAAFYMQDVAGHNGDVQVKFVEDADAGFVPVLGASFSVQVYDLLASPAADPINLAVAGAVDYKVALEGDNYAKPYAKFAYELVGEDLFLEAGVELGLIPNTTMTLKYFQGAKADNQVAADPIVNNADDKGQIQFAVKISY